jgi:hypothetical protein
VLGEKDTSTALGRMQAALRDVYMGFLNADYLNIDDETVAQLTALRQTAINEEIEKMRKSGM